MSIPVKNIYHLLTYAWHHLAEAEHVSLTAEEADLPLLHLLARVLQRGVTHVVKRGLARDYVFQEQVTARLRGKLLLGESVRQRTLQQAQAVCAFDELSVDILPNQLIKATLHRLLTVDQLPSAIHTGLRSLYLRFAEVSLVPIRDERVFEQVRLHRHTAYYGFLLSICHFIYAQALATQESGERLFQDFHRNERQMSQLFEGFVRGFYRHHFPHYAVSGRRLKWQLEAESDHAQRLLPTMLTDLVLEGANRTILIDCKYYQEALVQHHNQQRLISAHLYQLFAYQHHLQHEQVDKPVESMLLYPVVDQSLRVSYRQPGTQSRVHVVTVNLNQSWPAVEAELLTLLNDQSESI
ncbi:5-methylcytosine restriction system specificity protein McrC [Hymenobacter sp. 102]|uniref:5-methylcytosine restriction system specificity protein McrC n=1 Tax=Hymenobacter sp. 102 TaxID=3403152 RepID=UPI003CF643C3